MGFKVVHGVEDSGQLCIHSKYNTFLNCAVYKSFKCTVFMPQPQNKSCKIMNRFVFNEASFFKMPTHTDNASLYCKGTPVSNSLHVWTLCWAPIGRCT